MPLKKINIKIIILSICFLIFNKTHLLYSQKNNDSNTKNCLWKIHSKTDTAYIVGSVHLLKKDNYPLNQIFDKVFNCSQNLILELNPDSISEPNIQDIIFKNASYSDGKTLKEIFSEDSYNQIKSRTIKLGMEIESLDQFKPWYVAITLASFTFQKMGFEPKYGIDQYFYKKAKANQKEIIGLETVTFQTELLAKMSEENQKLMLLQTLTDLEVIENELDNIIKTWQDGNIKALEKILLQSFKEYPQIYKTMISERNKIWLPTILNNIEQNKNILIVVGTGHLVGPNGLIKMFEEKGYTIEQL
jgi:uncharacterized protein YbaP (TraB family)